MQKIGKLIGMLLIAVVFVVIPLYGCGDNVETVTNYDLDVIQSMVKSQVFMTVS